MTNLASLVGSLTDADLARLSPIGLGAYAIEGWQSPRHLLLLNHKLMLVASGRIRRLLVTLPPRHGKLCADDTPVFTVDGWKPHGELRVGDMVFHPSGRPIAVVAVGEPSYADRRVVFSDGETVDVHVDHEWQVVDRSKDHRAMRVVETREIEESTFYGVSRAGKPRARFMVPYADAIDPDAIELPLDPYVLGVWLGDGAASKAEVCGAEDDLGVVLGELSRRGWTPSSSWYHKTTGVKYVSFRGMRRHLRLLKVLGDKHIPELYLRASAEQRRDLLRGLVDTDGSLDGHRYRVVSCDRKLVDGVVSLVHSLGYRATVTSQDPALSSSGVQGRRVVYTVQWTPHDDHAQAFLPRKQRERGRSGMRRMRSIQAVERIQPKVGRCIQVDAVDGLYCVGEAFIPTHNSEFTSKIFPAWYMGTFPTRRLILASYESTFASSWGAKARDLLAKHGKDLWGVEVSKKRSSASWWATSAGGEMYTAGAGGSITGKGGFIGIIDDPFKNEKEANSQLVRDSVWDWYRATFYTRIEPGGGLVLIQTRWHADDLAGRVLEHEEWEHFDLPAISFAENDALGRQPGEALWPERYSLAQLEEIRDAVGAYYWQSLYQQNPVPPEGALFKERWFKTISQADLPDRMNLVRGWDEAASENGDWTVGALVGEANGNFYVVDVVRGRWTPRERDQRQRTTADMDAARWGQFRVLQWGQQDPGAAGKSRAEAFARQMVPYRVGTERPTGNKVLRADGLRSQAEAGNVYLVRGEWNSEFLHEATSFPYGAHDDQVDAVSWAFAKLAEGRKMRRGGLVPLAAWG